MKILLVAILVSAIVAVGLQMVLPFPYGLIFGIGISAVIIWRAWSNNNLNQHSLINYRRTDPKTNKEKEQNKEAFRILKKRFLEGEISSEEFEHIKKEFDMGDEN